ncbi:DUF1876 family protein [Mycolicibacterium sp. Y3]
MSVEERAERLDPVEDGWLVTISIDDREDQTVAKAKLNFQGREWVGAGLARLAPSEQGPGGSGSQVAVTRALSDLARSLEGSVSAP